MANLPDLFRRNRSLFSDFFHDLDDFFGGRSMMPRSMDITSPDMGRFDFDVEEDNRQYTAMFEVPGFRPDDIKVDVSGNMLTVCAEHKEEKEEGKQEFIRRYGRLQRSLLLPADVNSENIKAHYENGILEVVIPKSEVAKRRTIEIQPGRATRGEPQLQGKARTSSTAAAKSETSRH